MTTDTERKLRLRRVMRLREIMEVHKLISTDIGVLVGRSSANVRKWRCGALPVPEELLRLLEFELQKIVLTP
jgi:hypothetical protein